MRTCVAGVVLLQLAACCPPGAPFCPAPDAGTATAAWRPILDEEDLDGAVLSVWGSGPQDVLAVGGPLGNGAESLVVRLHDGRWSRLHPGGTETFWWVHGSASDNVWMVGERGRIARFDGSSFHAHTVPTTATLWGVQVFSPSDVWAVGGTPEQGMGADNDLIFHFDGSTWTRETLPGTPLGVSHFKVWGTSSENLYVVGEQGTIWHRTAGGWVNETNNELTRGTLFTVHGCSANDVYAAGGAAVLHFDGTAWSKLDSQGNNGLNGVSCGGGSAVVVGFGGTKLRWVDGAFVDESDEEPYTDLHAAWFDGAGAFWVGGGDWLSRANMGVRRAGAVGRFGAGPVPTTVE